MSITQEKAVSEFFRSYDLDYIKKNCQSKRQPFPHQQQALEKLSQWFKGDFQKKGGLLVLPTGGGKTLTSIRFLCQNPLSNDYKILWLAHTHHLLEQAINEFGNTSLSIEEQIKKGFEVSNINSATKKELNVRLVSGATGHFPVHKISKTDDVVISTLQTISKAYKLRHESLEEFLKSSNGKLFIVFDEAHHAPAPTYRRLITSLQERFPEAVVLGLTATPTYADESKIGWFEKLFPQKVLYQVKFQTLQASGILAKPNFEYIKTDIKVPFPEEEYREWIDTYAPDLPSQIITYLAENRERNSLIVDAYVKDKDRYGKTIIFADKWTQCEFICDLLVRHGIRADAIYTHVSSLARAPEERNKGNKTRNAQVLERFKNNELDVLVNIKMATEGTDVPDVKTVFITRETKSKITLTQMVGRALRGKKSGGTEEAFIVCFKDEWDKQINWADIELEVGDADDTESKRQQYPLKLISVNLLRKLVEQIEQGKSTASEPFMKLMPLGWYMIEFEAAYKPEETLEGEIGANNGYCDAETFKEILMVYEDEIDAYEQLINFLLNQDLEEFEDPAINFDEKEEFLSEIYQQYFAECSIIEEKSRLRNIFNLVRHLAQKKQKPIFFQFEERDNHDFDTLAERIIDQRLDLMDTDTELTIEYSRSDRCWEAICGTFDNFSSQFDLCKNRIIRARRHSISHSNFRPQQGSSINPDKSEAIPDREPDQATKEQMLKRDGYRCLACGEETKRKLEADHIRAHYYGGCNELSNLQTLCRKCNGIKSVKELIFFNNHRSSLKQARGEFDYKKLGIPTEYDARDLDEWKRFLTRAINFYYGCAAVADVQIFARGEGLYNWKIELYKGNPLSLIEPFGEALLKDIQSVRRNSGVAAPVNLSFITSDEEPLIFGQRN